MSLFEDMVIKAKSAVDVVGAKTGKFVDISKLNISLAELKGEIRKKFEELGSMVYYSDKDGTCDESLVKSKIKIIDDLYKEAEALGKKISELKNKIVCGACGYQNQSEASYCIKCGNALEIKCDPVDSSEHGE